LIMAASFFVHMPTCIASHARGTMRIPPDIHIDAITLTRNCMTHTTAIFMLLSLRTQVLVASAGAVKHASDGAGTSNTKEGNENKQVGMAVCMHAAMHATMDYAVAPHMLCTRGTTCVAAILILLCDRSARSRSRTNPRRAATRRWSPWRSPWKISLG
jgi:hypothetical protein